MSRNWTIRLAAFLTVAALSAGSAQAQFRPFFYDPYLFPGYGGFGNYSMTPGFGGGYGYAGAGAMGYNSGVFTPGLSYSPFSYSYSGPIILGSESSVGSRSSTLVQATPVAPDSPLLLAAYDAPTRDNRCVVVVVVPDGRAQVWFEGSLTNLTGRVRRFTTPPLVPNKNYEYDVFVQWSDANGLHSEPRRVEVQAGGVVNVLFADTASNTATRKR